MLGRRSRRRRTADRAPANSGGVDPMMLPPEPDRWTIELANAQRMEAIAAFGFTERQARLLMNVLLHSGVFVERQYCSFAGIVHGQKSTDFLKTLVERRLATPISTGKLHRGRMFHVHYKPLWAAIGEPDNRFRKPTAQGRMIERVMLLDAVLDDREFVWLGPSMDKRRHFRRHLGDRLEVRDYPHLLFGEGPEKTVRYFPDKLPVGIQAHADTHVFVYLRDASLADGLPAVPAAARATTPCPVPMDGPAATSASTLEGQTGLPARGPGAPRNAAAPVGRPDVGVAVPRTEATRRTGRRACRRALSRRLKRLPHAAVSS